MLGGTPSPFPAEPEHGRRSPEVLSAARFRLSVVGVWIPDEWRPSASAAGRDCANGKARMGS
jgi:hypothetical protein